MGLFINTSDLINTFPAAEIAGFQNALSGPYAVLERKNPILKPEKKLQIIVLIPVFLFSSASAGSWTNQLEEFVLVMQTVTLVFLVFVVVLLDKDKGQKLPNNRQQKQSSRKMTFLSFLISLKHFLIAVRQKNDCDTYLWHKKCTIKYCQSNLFPLELTVAFLCEIQQHEKWESILY